MDTFACDSVFFADVRGSMVDLVQAVGRALRTTPDSGKVATIVVPVLLAAGESGENLLTSKAYDGLAKVLLALRAHDEAAVERLALPQSETRPEREPRHSGELEEVRSAGGEERLLSFSSERDPAVIAAFVRTRVLEPEREEFRRGLEELTAYRKAFGDVKVPYAYRAPSGHRLGVWVADQRRYKAAAILDDKRIAELDALGMVWSAFDTAFTDNLVAVAGYAAELAPRDADGIVQPLVTIVTDNGGPFRSFRIEAFIATRPELRHIRTRVRTPGQNGSRERGFGSLKYEKLFLEEIPDALDLVRHAEDYRRDDNTVRPHEALAWNRPHDVHTGAADPLVPNFPEPENLPIA
ncbi:Helicase associated domain protein [Kitasatospora sp. NPDC090308]|uniref:Helicase associated domain protein n=1 Tax=Kitasatospora sp. NPDC090308 TaxID=3364082 RepID=UPI00380FAD0C